MGFPSPLRTTSSPRCLYDINLNLTRRRRCDRLPFNISAERKAGWQWQWMGGLVWPRSSPEMRQARQEDEMRGEQRAGGTKWWFKMDGLTHSGRLRARVYARYVHIVLYALYVHNLRLRFRFRRLLDSLLRHHQGTPFHGWSIILSGDCWTYMHTRPKLLGRSQC